MSYITWQTQTENSVRIIVASDTHNFHRKKVVPDGDIFIHCGDMTNFGRDREVADFNEFLGELKHKHRIVICGNHEIGVYDKCGKNADLIHAKCFSNATCVLLNSSTIVEGIKIYGAHKT
jgi:predicted MPP superfamily phosphohydrolase